MPDHVVILVEENHSFEEIRGNADAPFLNRLADGPKSNLLTESFGIQRPSQPNYLHLFSGSNQNVNSNAIVTSQFTTSNLGANLIASGRSFVGYSEDLPEAGSLVASAPGVDGVPTHGYQRKHNPWSNWQGSSINGLPPETNQPFSSFPTDFTKLPTVAFVVPNQLNDMHDGTIAAGDQWFHDHISAYADWAKTHNSVLIVTFDEGGFSPDSQHIFTVITGESVRTGSTPGKVTHHNLLRTIEDMYDLPHSGAAADVAPITAVWNTPPVAAADSATTEFATATRISVLANDTDANQDSLSVTSTTNPAQGTVRVNSDQTITYTPSSDFSGTDTFTYTISDGSGGSATATVIITVTPEATDRSVLVGVPEFAVGADVGSSTATVYNPDGSTRFSITPFPGFTGGVRTATADFNRDGVADLVVGTGPGRVTRVMIVDGKSQAQLFSVEPFEASFTGGVYVSAGDVTGDGIPDLAITPDEGGGPRVDVYSGVANFPKLISFFGIDDSRFRGGARSAIADLNGDSVADLIVAAGFGGGPRVAGYDGRSLSSTPQKMFGDFFAFEPGLRNGIYVAAGDLNGDGKADLIAGGGPGGGPRVLAFDGASLAQNQHVTLANFFGGNAEDRGGIRLTVKDFDGDNRADLVVGSGVGTGSHVTAYLGKNIGASNTPTSQLDFDALAGFTGGVFVG